VQPFSDVEVKALEWQTYNMTSQQHDENLSIYGTVRIFLKFNQQVLQQTGFTFNCSEVLQLH
jgi:hypothetical protein